MIYRLGNIIGAYNGPRIASTRVPNKLGAQLEFFNALIGVLFMIVLQLFSKNLFIYSILYFFKGVCGGLHNNIRFQWLKALHLKTEISAKVLLYNGAIVQAAFGVGGSLLILTSKKDILFFKTVLTLDIITSIIALFIFLKIQSKALPRFIKHSPSAIMLHLKRPNLSSLAVADLFIAMAVSGTNILIFKFGELAFSNNNGYAVTLILYSIAFIFSSLIINEIGTTRLSLLSQIFLFSLASLGMWILQSPLSIFCYLAFFLLYPLLFLRLEKAWFETLEQNIAGHIYAYRLTLLSLIWAVGELIYSELNYGLPLRSAFLIIGGLLLIRLHFFNKYRLKIKTY